MRALLLAAALGLTGCSLVGLDPDVSNVCTTDAECAGNTCDPDRGRCVALVDEPYDIVLEVTPNEESSTAPPPWLSGPVTIDDSLNLPVRFQPHVELRGRVRWAGDRVPAEIIVSRPGLEGRPMQRFRTTTFAEARTDDGEEYDFSVRLPPGGTFQAEIRPTSMPMGDSERPWLSVLPPLRTEIEVPVPSAEPGVIASRWYRPFAYPEGLDTPCTRELRAGCTLAGSVLAMEDGTPEPQEGLQVRAVDSDGRVVSSAAFTDEVGAFSIVLSPNAESYVLRVSASSDRPLFPAIRVDPAFLTEELTIRVPTTQVVEYEGRVEGPDEAPVPGATITFRSDSVVDAATGIGGSFETTATSGEDGHFSATLLAGEYEVVVTPVLGRLTVLTEELSITASEGIDILRGQLFTLKRASQLGASITDFAGREVPSATVQAAALARPFEDLPASEFNRTQMGTADETGQVTVPLDVGVYDLTFRGGAASGYAWRVMPEVAVLDPGSTLMERIVLEAPVPVTGDVLGPDEMPLVDAEVRAFARTESGRYVEIASGRTDISGQYELLLPPSFE
jgi:hypothetical protein